MTDENTSPTPGPEPASDPFLSADLQGQLTELMQLTTFYHEFFLSLMEAGFSAAQSLNLVGQMLRELMKSSLGGGESSSE